jgi:rhodanese-related sulfurtransferase
LPNVPIHLLGRTIYRRLRRVNHDASTEGVQLMVATITREEVKARLDSGERLVLVEALPPNHYRQAHLTGAVNLPHDRVDALAATLLPDKTAPIVVYCANGPCQNSAIAAQRLAALGYTDVREYQLGKQDWIEAGLPVESGTGAEAAA